MWSAAAQDSTQVVPEGYKKIESNDSTPTFDAGMGQELDHSYDTIAEGSAGGTIKPVQNVCSNRNELREEARLLLKPFKYCMAKTTMINMKRHPQLKYVLVPVYSDQSHRVVFSTKGLPQGIRITVYNGPKDKKKREILYQATNDPGIDSFELPENYKHDYLYIEYDIPPTDQVDRSYDLNGCVIFMMGYQNLPDVINQEDSMGNTASE